MTYDAGWVEALDVGTSRVLARAHLQVDGYQLEEGAWQGHLDSVHAAPNAPALESRQYVLQFGGSAEQRLVHVEISHNAVIVHGEDGVIPTVLTELAEGT